MLQNKALTSSALNKQDAHHRPRSHSISRIPLKFEIVINKFDRRSRWLILKWTKRRGFLSKPKRPRSDFGNSRILLANTGRKCAENCYSTFNTNSPRAVWFTGLAGHHKTFHTMFFLPWLQFSLAWKLPVKYSSKFIIVLCSVCNTLCFLLMQLYLQREFLAFLTVSLRSDY